MRQWFLQIRDNGGLVVWKAIGAGIGVGLGGTVYLGTQNDYLGAFLFAVGLFTICAFGLNLFTGRIGYVSTKHFVKDTYHMALIWLGNLIGTNFVALSMRLAGKEAMIARAQALCEGKMSLPPLTVFLTAIFCGMLMYIAVHTYRRFADSQPVMGAIALFLCVVTFIFSGFEHCIANMYYVGIAGLWSGETLLMVLIATAGNTVGATIIRQFL